MILFFRLRLLRIFCRELATLLDSGITVIDAFGILSQHAAGRRLRAVSGRIRTGLARGKKIDEALAVEGDLFPVWFISLVKYSHIGGSLGKGLRDAARRLENDYNALCKLIAALAYPVLLFNLAVFIFPLSRLVSSGIAAYLSDLAKTIFPVYFFIFLFWFSLYALARWAKPFYDNAVLWIPVCGGFVKKTQIAAFVKTLKCLVGAGVGVIEAYEIAVSNCSNRTVAAHLLRGLPVLKHGEGLEKAFSAAGMFSPSFVGMIAAAQKSGSIVEVLEKIASYSEQESETVINVFIAVFPVLIYIGVAVYIGYRVISFYSGYFSKILTY